MRIEFVSSTGQGSEDLFLKNLYWKNLDKCIHPLEVSFHFRFQQIQKILQ